jgi:hypothetical protein
VLRLQYMTRMRERRIRTRAESASEDFSGGGTITRLRIELHESAGLSARERPELAVPLEIISSDTTERYSIGLREDLCHLSRVRS